MDTNSKYCNNLTGYSRLKTLEVTVGDVPLGAENPIRVQSMTTTNTLDTRATVEQSIRMIEAGCEYIRITAPSLKEAQNLQNIKMELRSRGYKTPLIADIHFTPNAAELAARIVEKVRVNPGNYADKKKFQTIAYTEAAYQEELERIRTRFVPLIKICKEYGTAMRIGTNHGSLSDRILSRYGDTPLGMVESAFEFLRICEDFNFHNIVLSMKASNTLVMVQAYRLLVSKMMETNRNYPLHLGVTEAGEGEDGRIKSAVGIGSLLEDGLGDTIRVSLTEEPEFEIPVAKMLISRYNDNSSVHIQNPEPIVPAYNPFEYKRRESLKMGNFGANQVPRVVADFSKHVGKISPVDLSAMGYRYNALTDKWNIGDQACDYLFLGNNKIDFEIPGTLGLIYNYPDWLELKNKTRCYPLISIVEFNSNSDLSYSRELNFVSIPVKAGDVSAETFEKLNDGNFVCVFESENSERLAQQRAVFIKWNTAGFKLPVILKRHYDKTEIDKFLLHASTDIGGLLVDGFGDGIWIDAAMELSSVNSASFGILQATRTRISKTEYISCPSCGRTLFDLQETTLTIRKRTDHLKGIKIGIMGCIVNGPGEMADADYGYVGTGIGKITLYKGKEVIQRNIQSEKAVDALIELIKKNGDWQEREN